MDRFIRLSFLLALCSLRAAAADAPHATPKVCNEDPACVDAAFQKSVNAAKQGQYMQASFGLLQDLGVDAPGQITNEDAFDQWRQVFSAMTGSPGANDTKAAYRHVSKEEVAALRAATVRPAIAEIFALAKHTRIVILDEDHLVPRDRAFALEVARALRPLGYSLLAVEGLSRDKDDAVSLSKMQALQKDGFVRRGSGYYLNDPVFADYLRQAMALGYRLVAYESAGFLEEQDEEARFVRREEEQAENIVHRAIVPNPGAKILIYSGFHHAAKTELAQDTVKGRIYMAARLKRLTGIEPLVIDQCELGPAAMYRPDVDVNAIVSSKATHASMVLISGGKPLIVGLLAGAVDLQVVHPPVQMQNGRPGWLVQLGRSAADIPASLLPTSGVRLIQAFLSDEPEDAIPIDQVLVTAGELPPKLMLPNARVRYAYQDDVRKPAIYKDPSPP
jgi:hypothetical protein